MFEEPQSGLIDIHWFISYIIIPLVLIGTIVGIFYGIGTLFKCPYIEDVSSCFPYNLPDWVKLIMPLICISFAIALVVIIRKIERTK